MHTLCWKNHVGLGVLSARGLYIGWHSSEHQGLPLLLASCAGPARLLPTCYKYVYAAMILLRKEEALAFQSKCLVYFLASL